MQLFHFINFIQFSKKNLQNGQNVPKKGKNSKKITFGGQNMTFFSGPKAHYLSFPSACVRSWPLALEPPAGARIFWRVAPKNSSNKKHICLHRQVQ